MKEPKVRDLVALKRTGRYLLLRPRLVQHFPLQKEPEAITTYVDTDHAGCLGTRKSTTGLVLRSGLHVLRTNSNMQ